MTSHPVRMGAAIAALLSCASCGGGASTPTAPSPPTSFLAGTWQGTMTIQPLATGPQPSPLRRFGEAHPQVTNAPVPSSRSA